jgi:hypothetical protein
VYRVEERGNSLEDNSSIEDLKLVQGWTEEGRL